MAFTCAYGDLSASSYCQDHKSEDLIICGASSYGDQSAWTLIPATGVAPQVGGPQVHGASTWHISEHLVLSEDPARLAGN